ncbi:hypothetical protein [Rhizobium sp. 11515TR]|uniref:hypothetical protein n=1 Tax=Rhizobium sp. 11515TR TaxID=2028343 RepID=UPI000BA86AB9|nr:hypothetical protein [Rhizobium sp. 11515TR]ASW06408.1 hypothetical protein CKA34_11260 [Rhizobium sp. 11515TR]
MDPHERSRYPENIEDFHRVFKAAKEDGPQQVFDGEGVFTVSYTRLGSAGTAKDFLTRGGPEEE